MCTFQNFFDTRRPAFIFIISIIAILVLSRDNISFSKEAPDIGVPTLLVLDNCNIDKNRTASSYGDYVFLLNSKGKVVKRLLLGLNIGDNFPGGRVISTSGDGRYFVVCSDVGDRITVYETVTGIKVWSLTGIFKSAVFANGQVYALNNESVFAIDNTGTIVKHSRIGGFDIVVAASGDCLWIVGQDIKKCSLDLKIMMTVKPIRHGACSVDINPDGSIWVADRFVGRLKADDTKSRLLKISSRGNILKAIDLNISPVCVRVNKSDGSVWITGTRERYRDFSVLSENWPDTVDSLNDLIGDETEPYTLKYDANGNFLLSIAEGGSSIVLDSSDNSVWLTSGKKIWQYSSEGTILTEQTEVSDNQKWLVIINRKSKGK